MCLCPSNAPSPIPRPNSTVASFGYRLSFNNNLCVICTQVSVVKNLKRVKKEHDPGMEFSACKPIANTPRPPHHHDPTSHSAAPVCPNEICQELTREPRGGKCRRSLSSASKCSAEEHIHLHPLVHSFTVCIVLLVQPWW